VQVYDGPLIDCSDCGHGLIIPSPMMPRDRYELAACVWRDGCPICGHPATVTLEHLDEESDRTDP